MRFTARSSPDRADVRDVPRVLLVDDSALIRNSIQTALEPYGLDLAHAENGKVAVAKATSSRWDLIFLDVVMPIMDGIQALTEIRGAGVKTPVVLTTSVSTTTAVTSAVKLGGVTYLRKPFTPDAIRLTAEKLLKLDRSVLASPPRMLLLHTDPHTPAALAKVLPPHIAIDATSSLGDALDLAEAHGHSLVVFETDNLIESGQEISSVLREQLPAAGIFALDATGTREPWRPNGALDGVLPKPLDATLGRGFLYANFLRPLVFVDKNTTRTAGFQGPVAHLPAYLTSLERAVQQQCIRRDLSQEIRIDLCDVEADPAAVVALVSRIDTQLRDAGAAPTFQLGPQLAKSPDLSHVLIV